MENTLRIIITIFFIGLIALAIIFFGIFGILPLTKIGSLKKNSTSTEAVVPVPQPIAQVPSVPGISPQTTTPETQTPGQYPDTMTPNTGNVPPPGSSAPNTEPEISTPPPPKVVRLDVPPGSPDAPQQSNAISADQVPTGSLHIVIKDGKFIPSSFAVRSGEPVVLYVTSADGRAHSINFSDPSVQGIAIGVGPNETRSIAFTAPKVGSYTFQCSVPGHAALGETGTMVVE